MGTGVPCGEGIERRESTDVKCISICEVGWTRWLPAGATVFWPERLIAVHGACPWSIDGSDGDSSPKAHAGAFRNISTVCRTPPGTRVWSRWRARQRSREGRMLTTVDSAGKL